MIKLSTRYLMILAGVNWLLVGLFLLTFGLYLEYTSLIKPYFPEEPFSLLAYLMPKMGTKSTACISVIFLGLSIGYFKGKYVLKKTASKEIKRLQSLTPPHPLNHLYTWKYLLLILIMMSMGMGLRLLPIHGDVRGLIDIAVGAALIHGALHYLQHAQKIKNSTENTPS